MSASSRADTPPGPPGILADIARELRAAFVRPARIRELGSSLALAVSESAPADPEGLFHSLGDLLAERSGEPAQALWWAVAPFLDSTPIPPCSLIPLLRARDAEVRRAVLERVLRRSLETAAPLSCELAAALNRCWTADPELFADTALHGGIAAALRGSAAPPVEGELTATAVRHENPDLRELAARILDTAHAVPDESAVRYALGPHYELFAPHLAYSRAGFAELEAARDLASRPAALESFRDAADRLGDARIRDVVAALGWRTFRAGIVAEPFLAAGGAALPYFLALEDEWLLRAAPRTPLRGRGALVFAHEQGRGDEAADRPAEAVGRFRELNLRHARVLGAFLAVAPLDRERALRLLGSLEEIVAEYVAVFPEEGPAVTARLDDLSGRIRAAAVGAEKGTLLTSDVARLVLAFEDPASLGEVRTLHGLKRYLHQRGLRLASRLAASAEDDRAVTVALVERDEIVVGPRIRFVDFEARPEDAAPGLPFGVRLLAAAWGRALRAGRRDFPGARAVSYGNEIHYFFSFGSHPVFVRVDLSPPLRGGMVDVEYFGVSKVDLAQHPDASLPVLTRFLRELEFDVSVEGTRVRARFDKERSIRHDAISPRAAAILGLAPYLMDLDWIVGGLDLEPSARERLAARWARLYREWGVLPVESLLTRDRRGVLVQRRAGPAGEAEVRWSGDGEPRDRWEPSGPAEPAKTAHAEWARHGLGRPEEEASASGVPGQIALDGWLAPLRAAVRSGVLIPLPESGALTAGSSQRLHECDAIAHVLDDPEELAGAMRLAHQMRRWERTIPRDPIGLLDGATVEQARVTPGDESFVLAVLRDEQDLPLAALAAPEPGFIGPAAVGDGASAPSNAIPAEQFLALLRLHNLIDADPENEPLPDPHILAAGWPPRAGTEADSPGALRGIRAAAGRTTGRAALGAPTGNLRGYADRILVRPTFTPTEAPALTHAAGVVTTGGGALSHIGLLASQLGKPAMVVSGTWVGPEDSPTRMEYSVPLYDVVERIVAGRAVRAFVRLRRETRRLEEGDYLVLDADAGVLRVLGSGREVGSLCEALRRYGEAIREGAATDTDEGTLSVSGLRLQARHLIEKALDRLSRIDLVRFAVDELLDSPAFLSACGALDAARFLKRLLARTEAGPAARDQVTRRRLSIEAQAESVLAEARRSIPESPSLYDVLALRLGAMRAMDRAGRIRTVLEAPRATEVETRRLDECARARLRALRGALATEAIAGTFSAEPPPGLPYRLQELQRIDRALGLPRDATDAFAYVRDDLTRRQSASRERLARAWVIPSGSGGVELASLLGWKAAHLGEAARALGEDCAPPWFAVTRAAFLAVLETAVQTAEPLAPERAPLGDALQAVLEAPIPAADRARRVRRLWERVTLPPALKGAVLDAYRTLAGEPPVAVAVRSSGREEDRTSAARAGEFDTFLFVNGAEDLLRRIRLAWGGLWSERAILAREELGIPPMGSGGAVLVQRMIRSRVSGVIQTVHVAEGLRREIVVSAGLGLGEGIVSGRVNSDTAILRRTEGDAGGPYRVRYETRDKPLRIDYDERAGTGTIAVETLYHQRLRPALEYVELLALAERAERLEAHFRVPLDLEFALDDARAWILQVRPIPACQEVYRETVERRPLRATAPGEEGAP